MRECLQILLDHGVVVCVVNQVEGTALCIAAATGDSDSSRLLLKHGPVVDSRNYNGETALVLAVKSRSMETTRILLEHGADCNLQNRSGETPLWNASSTQDITCMGELLRRGADPNIPHPSGRTMLLKAKQRLNDLLLYSQILSITDADHWTTRAQFQALIDFDPFYVDTGLNHSLFRASVDRTIQDSIDSDNDSLIVNAGDNDDSLVGNSADCFVEDKNGMDFCSDAIQLLLEHGGRE